MTNLFKGIFIYGLGQILSKLVTFCLLPLLTAYLTAEDYGLIGATTLLTQCLAGFFGLGMSVVIGRYYWDAKAPEEQHSIIWTAFIVLVINACLILTLCFTFKDYLAWMVFGKDAYTNLLEVALLTTALNNIVTPFYLYFRLNERAAFVVICSLFEIIVSITLSLYLVLGHGFGCYGLLLGGLLGQAVSGFIIFIFSCRELFFGVQLRLVPKMIKMGYPYIVGLLGYFLLQGSSRYVLEWQRGLEVMGLFFLGSSFGRTLELFVSSFISAWVPFYAPYVSKQEEATEVFGKIMSYYALGTCILLAMYFALARPIVHLMVQPTYYDIWSVVGIIASAQALWGVYSIAAAAFIFYKKSLIQMAVEIFSGLAAFVMNAILIFFWGREGAAIGMFFGFCVLLLVTFNISQRLLTIKYEGIRLLKIVGGLLILALISFAPINSLLLYTIVMMSVSIAYYAFLWSLCMTSKEKEVIADLCRKKLFPPLLENIQ